MAVFQDNIHEAPTVAELCSAVAGLSHQLQKEEHTNPKLVAAADHAASGTHTLTVTTAKLTDQSD